MLLVQREQHEDRAIRQRPGLRQHLGHRPGPGVHVVDRDQHRAASPASAFRRPSRSGSASAIEKNRADPTATTATSATADSNRVFPIPEGPRTTATAPWPRRAVRHAHDSWRSSSSRPIIGTALSNAVGTALNVTNSGTGPIPFEDGQ